MILFFALLANSLYAHVFGHAFLAWGWIVALWLAQAVLATTVKRGQKKTKPDTDQRTLH